MLNNENVDPNATRLLIQSYYLWVGLAQEVAISLARFAGLAALVLCCLSVRNAARKLVMWAWIPGGIAVIGFPAFLIATAQRRNAALDAFATAVNLPLPTEHTWSAPLGQGIYLVAAGLAVLAVALKLFRKGLISLPLSFRGTSEAETQERSAQSSQTGGVFVLVIGTIFYAVLASWGGALVLALSAKDVVWDSRSFPAFLWIPALLVAAGAAALAFVVGAARPAAHHAFFARQPFRIYLLALAIPLVCLLLPRFLFGVVFQPYLEPSRWPQLFIPHPLPTILVVYIIAFLEEFAIRGYLQSTLEKCLSLRRAIFVSGILWPLLLGFGMTYSLPHTVAEKFPGISLLAEWAMFIIYSVPLGWLYARTRSILAVTLTHGTIVIFHAGMGNEIHLNHPEFYWVELALWIFAGWFLFRKNPLLQEGRPAISKNPFPEPQK